MTRPFLITLIFLSAANPTIAQFFKLEQPKFSGMYFQWGYNRDWFTNSTIHFSNGNQYDFTLHKVNAKDQPDFSGFRDNPVDITIPQNSCRIGVYLNTRHTWAIELNYDHAKYVVTDSQKFNVKGHFGGEPVDAKDTVLSKQFFHMEHTNGANFIHINYVRQQPVWENKNRTLATVICKVGAGVVAPRSDITVNGRRLDAEYHIAGYIVSAEMGTRLYLLRNLFLEANIKGGYANYLRIKTVEGGTASHSFYYAEVIGLLGYNFNFVRKYRSPTGM